MHISIITYMMYMLLDEATQGDIYNYRDHIKYHSCHTQPHPPLQVEGRRSWVPPPARDAQQGCACHRWCGPPGLADAERSWQAPQACAAVPWCSPGLWCQSLAPWPALRLGTVGKVPRKTTDMHTCMHTQIHMYACAHTNTPTHPHKCSHAHK